ncbi:hypothetical protein LCGC14_0445970 [marine sediment metagenome]|uniref:Uncharacterized protein n=1 Tax=marine sediment metagenome TaxID=412755 RepID=A0A0F9SJ03_9ZZZZ
MKQHQIRAIFYTKHGQVAKTMCGRYILRSRLPRGEKCLSCKVARR